MNQIKIGGMSCQHCVGAAKKALEEMGLTRVEVDLQSGIATFNPTTAFSMDQVEAVVVEAGFTVVGIS